MQIDREKEPIEPSQRIRLLKICYSIIQDTPSSLQEKLVDVIVPFYCLEHDSSDIDVIFIFDENSQVVNQQVAKAICNLHSLGHWIQLDSRNINVICTDTSQCTLNGYSLVFNSKNCEEYKNVEYDILQHKVVSLQILSNEFENREMNFFSYLRPRIQQMRVNLSNSQQCAETLGILQELGIC